MSSDSVDEAGCDGAARILKAFREGRSDFVVKASGRVRRLLPDDLDGSRHQRLIVEIEGGHTLLLVHNIDVSQRVRRIGVGDSVTFKGEYEWTAEGGVVHWTHEDERDWHEDGYIEHEGRRYE